jgi:hypothetical protein
MFAQSKNSPRRKETYMKNLTRTLCLLLSLLFLFGCTPGTTPEQVPGDNSEDTDSEDTEMNENMTAIIQNGTTTFRLVRPDDSL